MGARQLPRRTGDGATASRRPWPHASGLSRAKVFEFAYPRLYLTVLHEVGQASNLPHQGAADRTVRSGLRGRTERLSRKPRPACG